MFGYHDKTWFPNAMFPVYQFILVWDIATTFFFFYNSKKKMIFCHHIWHRWLTNSKVGQKSEKKTCHFIGKKFLKSKNVDFSAYVLPSRFYKILCFAKWLKARATSVPPLFIYIYIYIERERERERKRERERERKDFGCPKFPAMFIFPSH